MVNAANRGQGNVGGDTGIEPFRRSGAGEGHPRTLHRRVVERGLRGIGDQGRDMSHAMHGSGPMLGRGRSAVLIAGPTASGKSALALGLAEQHGGTIVNADSMQVYRDLRIITARPSPEDEARAPHRLYGHIDAATNHSVGQWCQDVGAALDEAKGAGRFWSAAPASISRR